MLTKWVTVPDVILFLLFKVCRKLLGPEKGEPKGGTPMEPTKKDGKKISEILSKVATALQGLEYGEVVIKVNNGDVTFIDRHERVRV